jgi:hypothetical protein
MFPATIDLPANVLWFNTNIYVEQGQKLTVSATGTTNTCPDVCPGNPDMGPQGTGSNITCPFAEVNATDCAQNGVLYGLLLGRIGNGTIFGIGNGGTYVATNSGTLRLTINDNLDGYENNSGSLTVVVTSP